MQNKIGVIAHGILEFNVNKNKVEHVMSDYSEKYHLKDKVVFVALGRQSPYKGTDLICDAFAKSDYLQDSKEVFLIIAGKGDIATQEYANRYSNVLVVDYELSDSDFQAIMCLADVLLLPYRKISQSGVLLTAIQNQIPFAVTAIGGLAEPLETAPVGWIISSSTVASVRECMEKLVHNKERTKSVKHNQNNWDLVKAKYDWEKISHETEEFYNIYN